MNEPLSLEVNSFSPFHLKQNDHALLSLLKVISAPITVYHVRFLQPTNLNEVNLEEDNSISKYLLNIISKSFTDPETSHIYRLPQPTSPIRPAAVPPRPVYLSPGNNCIPVVCYSYNRNYKHFWSKWTQ